jgi:glycosyltransferase involved in cell wall biosynthesis
MRFHLVALPHTVTAKSYAACAFTIKTLNFAHMMRSLGHEVLHYGAEGSEVDATHVPIIARSEQEAFFGPIDPSNIRYDLDWSGRAEYWKLFNDRAAVEINKRKQRGDFICVIQGSLNAPIAAQVPDLMTVEYGIGYNGTFAKYRVFESYAHMHKIWGAQGGYDPDGRFYDVVIPNSLDPDDFPFKAVKGDYFLYSGRLIRRKGIQVAAETCKRLGARLLVAGKGCIKCERGNIHCEDGGVYAGEYVGCVTGKKRAQLYQSAKAVFVPSLYVEPFGTVAIEAQMAGTPVITTDFGAFPETVEHGKTGFRCHTLDQFVWAAQHVHELDPWSTHQRAVANYSMDRVRYRYQEYFEMLTDLYGDGWYTLKERSNLNWLRTY